MLIKRNVTVGHKARVQADGRGVVDATTTIDYTQPDWQSSEDGRWTIRIYILSILSTSPDTSPEEEDSQEDSFYGAYDLSITFEDHEREWGNISRRTVLKVERVVGSGLEGVTAQLHMGWPYTTREVTLPTAGENTWLLDEEAVVNTDEIWVPVNYFGTHIVAADRATCERQPTPAN